MFDVLRNVQELFILSLLSFFIIYTIRYLFIRNIKLVFLYYAIIFIIMFCYAVVGAQVISDASKRLEKFIELEQNNELENAKNNLAQYDSMFQLDLRFYKDSNEFLDEINTLYVHSLNQAEAILIGWLYVVISECSILLNFIFRSAK